MNTTPATIFASAVKAGASDVHIVAGSPIVFRINGNLEQQGEVIDAAAASAFVKAVLSDVQWKRFETEKEIDIAYALDTGIRFRVNCHVERGNPSLVARVIPQQIPSLADIGLTGTVAEQLCQTQDGLILFTGPTGCGKSTSLAAMINHMMSIRTVHVLTLEDPIEFLFSTKKGLVRQRELGGDFTSFPEALKRVLRQDPNIVMVGEMRDLETIAAALTLAETGHLIFGTLHTPNVVQTVDRIVDVFPPHQQHQIRMQLSLSLKAVIAQRLLPKEGGGRVAQREILVNTTAIGNIIRDNRGQELKSAIQTGKSEGMVTFEADAKRLLVEKMISKETAAWASL